MSSIPQTSDSIEFHCSGCGRALKVPASASGKRASCPQCNTIVQVPLFSESPAPAAMPPVPHGPPRRDGRDLLPAPNPAAVTLVLPPQQGASSSLLTPPSPPSPPVQP